MNISKSFLTSTVDSSVISKPYQSIHVFGGSTDGVRIETFRYNLTGKSFDILSYW